jgi:hypothetical protein
VSSAKRSAVHDEVWLLLPWLANDRLSGAEREHAEQHVRLCQECARELQAQRRLRDALSAPERVTYAPAPSFRKLLERLDGPGAQAPEAGESSSPRKDEVAARGRRTRNGNAALWRPPGLAWAASFLLMFGITALVATAYRWSEPLYATKTDSQPETRAGVLHIAFDRELTVGEVEELLRADGARIVAGPDATGIFGIAPVARAGVHGSSGDRQLLELSVRLRADPRVRWIEPLETDDAAPGKSSGRGP